MKRLLLLICMNLLNAPMLWGGEAKKAIEVFPSTPVYQYIIYANLVILWIAIIGLIVIIRMKLKDIERLQRMGLDSEK